LQDAQDWLTQPDSQAIGLRRWNALRNAQNRLRDWPYSGIESPEHPGRRVLFIAGYSVVYRIERDTGDSATAGHVVVLAIIPPGKGDRRPG
jgi:hypothetical protein